jgi:hypothetical protein
MRTETFKGTISSAYGRTLTKKLNFKGEYLAFGPDKDIDNYTQEDWQAAYKEIQEFENGKELPTTGDIVTFVNNKRLANARQKEMTATLDAAGIEKPTLESADFRFEQMVKVLRAAGQSESEAKKNASMVLGMEQPV